MPFAGQFHYKSTDPGSNHYHGSKYWAPFPASRTSLLAIVLSVLVLVTSASVHQVPRGTAWVKYLLGLGTVSFHGSRLATIVSVSFRPFGTEWPSHHRA